MGKALSRKGEGPFCLHLGGRHVSLARTLEKRIQTAIRHTHRSAEQLVQELLAPPHRQALLEQICHGTAVSPAQLSTLYRKPLERYAELVQLFPASESHHHAHLGGLSDHGLEIVVCALKLRQSYLLPPGTPPEIQTQQAEAWTAGIAYAALLHDIGKLVTDSLVEDYDGQHGCPWHGPLRKPYRFRHNPQR